MSPNDADLTTSTRPKAVSTTKSNKFQNTIRNSLEKQQQQQLLQQQKQSELKQQEENTQLNDEENKLNARLKVDSQSENLNKIQNKDKIVNKVDDLLKDGLIKQQNIANNSKLNSLTSTTSNNDNNNANNNNTNQNLALFLNLLKNQAWTAPGGPTSPVQQQQQQQNLLNFSFLPLVQNNPQLQLASLFQNPLLANILNIRLNAATSPNLPSPQSLTPASSNSSNSSLDDVNDFSSSSFCQNQPINLSKIKEESLCNDAPLDLSNRKVEKKISQENFHTVNSLYSTTINRNANTFSDLNGKWKLYFIYSFLP
jgi:hypothetical protein